MKVVVPARGYTIVEVDDSIMVPIIEKNPVETDGKLLELYLDEIENDKSVEDAFWEEAGGNFDVSEIRFDDVEILR